MKILPSINNIDFAGRVWSEPRLNGTKTVMTFDLIRNFGGEKSPVILTFTMFKPKKGFPAFVKKGAALEVHAYFNPNTYTGKDGEQHEEVQYVVKNVKEAELVEKDAPDSSKGEEPVDLDVK